jgi:pullulanase
MKKVLITLIIVTLFAACFADKADTNASANGSSSLDTLEDSSAHQTDGIDIFFEKPSGWSNAWMWFDIHSDDVWETTVLATAPGDITWYRNEGGKDWYKKSFDSTSSVTFLFNDGTWNNKIADSARGGADFVTTQDIWVRADGSSSLTDPVDDEEGKTITIHFEKPSYWSNAFIWYDANSDDVWETTSLASPPGDMSWYRNADNNEWYKKEVTDVTSVTFLFNDGTWNNKIASGPANNIDFSTTTDVWIRADRTFHTSDPVDDDDDVLDLDIDRLGAELTDTKATFVIWSPDSSNVEIDVDGTRHDCKKIKAQDGYSNIYGIELQGDFHLKEYQFYINGKAVRDPYGKMVKYGDGPLTRVFEKDKWWVSYGYGLSTNIAINNSRVQLPGGWSARPALVDREDAIVYELHVRDFTIDANSGVSANKRGKFMGLVEGGTSFSGVTTGLDHLKELGVTHVQILPMYDYGIAINHEAGDTRYNWGYNPVNYNVPEESYSMDPDDYEYRMTEFKTMVDELHKNNIRVIMDVVYNHTFDKEMFIDISGRYYTPQDLSGCKNSTDTGEAMFSRFVRDSLEYWVTEYNVDGFRFDLMGIHHVDAVRSWGDYLNTKYADRNLLMYGEPWKGGEGDPEESQKVRLGKMPTLKNQHIGAFNDQFRQAIKGGSDNGTRGYMFNASYDGRNAWDIMIGLEGSLTYHDNDNEVDMWSKEFARDPEQTINYVTAHDNLTLTDKIAEAGITHDGYAERINRFANGIVLSSQGIPFLHSGVEFRRSKKHGPYHDEYHDSYMWGDEMNMIRWQNKVDNIGLFNYYKEMIELRKTNPGFTMTSWNQIKNDIDSAVINNQIVMTKIDNDYNIGNGHEIVVVVNPGNNYWPTLPAGTWKKVFDINGSTYSDDTTCEGTAVTVFKKQ